MQGQRQRRAGRQPCERVVSGRERSGLLSRLRFHRHSFESLQGNRFGFRGDGLAVERLLGAALKGARSLCAKARSCEQ
jgi:hypothetical protein